MRRWLPHPLDIILSVLVASAEALTLLPWLHLGAAMVSAQTQPPAWLVLGGLGLVAFWLARLLLAAGWDVGFARAISALAWIWCTLLWIGLTSHGGILAPLIGIVQLLHLRGPALALLILSALAWWRGLTLGADPRPFTSDFVRRSLIRDLVLVGSALFFVLVSKHLAESAGATLSWVVPTLAALRLITAATVQAAAVQHSAARRVGGTLQVRRWLSSATGLALFTVAFAALISLLAGPALWQWLATPLSWILTGIETVLFFILAAFAYVLFLLLTPITWLLHHGGSAHQPLPQQPPAFPTFHEAANHARFGLPPILRFGVELAIGISLAAGILLLVVRGLRRYHIATGEESTQDIHEATWSRALVMEQIRGLLRRPTQKRAQRRVPTTPQTVREAYQAALWLLSEYGFSRRAPETPLDYLARLQHMLNETTSTFADLTARYLVARYGERATSEDDTAAVADWQALHRSLHARSAQQRQGKRLRGAS